MALAPEVFVNTFADSKLIGMIPSEDSSRCQELRNCVPFLCYQ
jgi:hypothetical protein